MLLTQTAQAVVVLLFALGQLSLQFGHHHGLLAPLLLGRLAHRRRTDQVGYTVRSAFAEALLEVF
jgi:hypothetical protein